MQKSLILGLSSVLLLGSAPGFAQAQKKKPASLAAASAPPAASPAAKLQDLDELAAQAMKEWRVPGVAIAVVEDGKVI